MMKVATLKALCALTTDADLLSELDAEIAKAEKAQVAKDKNAAEKAAVYNEVKGVVLDALRDANCPVTAAELYEAVREALPEDFTKGKMVYGMTRLWTDEIVKDGNTYTVR